MISSPSEAYVWVWLPQTSKPIVAGRLAPTPEGLQFNYGRTYLARAADGSHIHRQWAANNLCARRLPPTISA